MQVLPAAAADVVLSAAPDPTLIRQSALSETLLLEPEGSQTTDPTPEAPHLNQQSKALPEALSEELTEPLQDIATTVPALLPEAPAIIEQLTPHETPLLEQEKISNTTTR